MSCAVMLGVGEMMSVQAALGAKPLAAIGYDVNHAKTPSIFRHVQDHKLTLLPLRILQPLECGSDGHVVPVESFDTM